MLTVSLDFKTTLKESLIRTSHSPVLNDPNNKNVDKIFNDVLTECNLDQIQGRADAVILEKNEVEQILKNLKTECSKTKDPELKKTYESLIKGLEEYNKNNGTPKTAFHGNENEMREKLEKDKDGQTAKDFNNLSPTEQEYALKYYIDKNDTKNIEAIFSNASIETIEMLILNGTVSINAKNGLGGYLSKEEYNKIIGLYLEKGKNKDKFFDDILNLTKDKDLTSKEKMSIISAFEAYKDKLSPEQQKKLDETKKSLDKSIEEKGGKTSKDGDIENFYKKFFGEESVQDVFSGKPKKTKDGKEADNIEGRTIKSSLLRSKETNPEELAKGLIVANLTSPEHIIRVTGDLSPKDQEKFLTTLLGELPADSLEEMFPFLVGQIFFLKSSGVIDGDDLAKIFGKLEESTNSQTLKDIFTDLYEIETDDLSDKDFLSEIDTKKFRADIMEEWLEIIETSSNENIEVLKKLAKKVITGETIEGTQEEGQSSESSAPSTTTGSGSAGNPTQLTNGSIPLVPVGSGQMFNMANHMSTQTMVAEIMGTGSNSATALDTTLFSDTETKPSESSSMSPPTDKSSPTKESSTEKVDIPKSSGKSSSIESVTVT